MKIKFQFLKAEPPRSSKTKAGTDATYYKVGAIIEGEPVKLDVTAELYGQLSPLQSMATVNGEFDVKATGDFRQAPTLRLVSVS